MIKRLIYCVLAFTPFSLAAQDLYSIDNITEIELTFEETNWDEIMDDNYASAEDTLLIGTLVVNGETYEEVGVGFKGNSSYNSSNAKNPLSIKLSYVNDQKYQGYGTFKLSSGYKDPSFIREILSYEIAREYMDVPLANYARVTINGEYYGLFGSIEFINGDYQERRLFCDDDNVRFKCNPEDVMEGGSSLEYLGSDSASYYSYYELKSDEGWADLIQLTETLLTDITEIESVLDVDRALWMLAFNSVFVNLDSYTGPFQQNYYLIADDSDRMMSILWDLNECMGGFSMISVGGPPGPTELEDLTEMDLFLREDDSQFPLISQLFSVPRYRKMYVAHVKTMVELSFSDDAYLDRAEEIQDIIESEVAADPNGFYSVTQFNNNLNETVSTGMGPGSEFFGVEEIMSGRADYLMSTAEFGLTAPSIDAISFSPEAIMPFTTFVINTEVEDADQAFFAYRNDYGEPFVKLELFDDGMHDDGAAGDGVFGGSLMAGTKDIQYYIYAENDEAAKFSPRRAEHIFYHLFIQNDVVINEIMSKNEVSNTDPQGDYDDWIELYNTTDETQDLSGYYLSDQPTENPLKWEIPAGTTIEPGGYVIIWADEDTLDDGLHANFKLSSSGESVSLSDASGFEIAKVKYPEMSSGTTFGRFENGTGPYIRMFPTPLAENEFTSVSLLENSVSEDVLVYPNPATDLLNIVLENDNPETLVIYNLTGKKMIEKTMVKNTEIAVNDWESGIYIIYFPSTGNTVKWIKQ